VTKSQVVLDRPIKAIGLHEVRVALHPEVAVTVKVNVARSPEEADLQAQGVDVLRQMFEEETAPLVADELAAGEEPAEAADETEQAVEPAETAETAEAAETSEAPAEGVPNGSGAGRLSRADCEA